MKEVRIKLEDIQDNYGKLTGDLGAKEFINDTLNKNEFDLTQPYKKEVIGTELVITQ